MRHLTIGKKKPFMRTIYHESSIILKAYLSPLHKGRGKEKTIDISNIPVGHKNAVQRPSNAIEDRALRSAIEKANSKGDCIINVGNGYYRPDPKDLTDVAEFNEYMAKELHRARVIQHKRLQMKLTFERWREVGVFVGNTGQA